MPGLYSNKYRRALIYALSKCLGDKRTGGAGRFLGISRTEPKIAVARELPSRRAELRKHVCPTRVGSTPNVSAPAFAKISRSACSSIFSPDCVCRFSDLPLVTQYSSPFPRLSLTSFFLFSLLSLSPSFARIHSHTRAAFRLRVPARLVEGLLPARAKISVRKFRSATASEPAAKLDINLVALSRRRPSVSPTSFSSLLVRLSLASFGLKGEATNR